MKSITQFAIASTLGILLAVGFNASKHDEVRPVPTPAYYTPVSPTPVYSTPSKPELLNINTASAIQLDRALKGIGPFKAAEIVKYRETHGPFKSIEDLMLVPGIKGKTLDKIKSSIKI